MSRLESIDVARGLAALSVAVYHHGFHQALVHATHWEPWGVIGWPGAFLAVPVFFVLSGFCIHAGGPARSGVSTGHFFAQRLVRLYPAWLVAILISAVVLYWSGGRPDGRLWFTHLTLTNGFFDDNRLNPVLWSVSVECLLYLLYPLWFRFRQRHGLGPAVALAGSVSLASCLVTARLVSVPTGPATWFFLNAWCGWIGGAVLAEIWFGPRNFILSRAFWWIAGLTLGTVQAALVWNNVYAGAAYYLILPTTICLCVWPVSLLLILGRRFEQRSPSAWIALPWRWLAAVGLFSYSLYLLHVPVQSLRFVLFPHSVEGNPAKAVMLVAWFGLVLWVGWLAYRVIEEPAVRLGRQWLRQRERVDSSIS